MKKFIITMLIGVSGLGSITAEAQELFKKLYGRWTAEKFRETTAPSVVTDTLEFQNDGTFISRAAVLGNLNGMFRTDETRSVLILENKYDKKISEWYVTVGNDSLQLKKIVDEKDPKVHLLLLRLRNSNVH